MILYLLLTHIICSVNISGFPARFRASSRPLDSNSETVREWGPPKDPQQVVHPTPMQYPNRPARSEPTRIQQLLWTLSNLWHCMFNCSGNIFYHFIATILQTCTRERTGLIQVNELKPQYTEAQPSGVSFICGYQGWIGDWWIEKVTSRCID